MKNSGFRASARKLRPSPSMIVAMLALVVAMSGSAYAAAKINGKDIKKGTVTSKQIKDKTVTGTDVKDSSLTGADLKDGTVGSGDIAAGVIPTIPTIPGPAPIGTATSTTAFTVESLIGNVNVTGMNISYTVPAGANKIVATFNADCRVSTAADAQFISARILIDGVDASPAGYSSLCGPGDDDGGANNGSGGETLFTSGTITRTLAVSPGTHTIQVQAVQTLVATATLDNMSLVAISGS